MAKDIKLSKAKLSDLVPDDSNANKGTIRGTKALENSIQQFGFIEAGTLDKNNRIMGGNKRAEAVAAINLSDEVIIVETDGSKPIYLKTPYDLDTPEGRKIAYALNRIHELNFELDLSQLVVDLESGLDLSSLWNPDELSVMLEGAADSLLGGDGNPPQDAAPKIDQANQLRQKYGVELGQVWALGEHRLIVGDCRDEEVVKALLKGDQPEMMVTDPPYGVEYEPLFRERALGASDRRAQEIVNDNVSSWKSAFELFTGDVAYIWHADKQAITSGLDLQSVGFEIVATIIWKKPHSPFGQGHYNYQHEPCWYAARKGKTHQWAGGKDSTVWEIALDETVEGGHGTQKPLECMLRPIRNHTAKIIYDPFVGSGTTIVAGENLKRKVRAIEIDPGFAAISIQRWTDLTARDPIRLSE